MSKCIVCGTENLIPLMECENMPNSAQGLLTFDDLDNETGINLKLCQCKNCGLVQFDCKPVDYYKDVIRAGGFTTTMTDLRRREYEKLIDKYNLKNKKFIEIGCGRGEFLNVLQEYPVQAFGIENNAEYVELAKSSNLKVERQFADSSSTKIDGAPFDCFLSFNFLEHQPHPNEMMQCIYNNLADDGYGLITVPSFEYILENNSYYELLRDHIAYYSIETLKFLVEKNGFELIESQIINRDTIEIIVKKRKLVNVNGLLKNYTELKDQINEYLKEKISQGKKVAVYGASHQGFTVISTTNIQQYLSYIIDSAPFKHGKYAPASHLKIISPDEVLNDPVQCIIIIAPGYTEEIKNIIISKFGKMDIACIKAEKLEVLVEN